MVEKVAILPCGRDEMSEQATDSNAELVPNSLGPYYVVLRSTT